MYYITIIPYLHYVSVSKLSMMWGRFVLENFIFFPSMAPWHDLYTGVVVQYRDLSSVDKASKGIYKIGACNKINSLM